MRTVTAVESPVLVPATPANAGVAVRRRAAVRRARERHDGAVVSTVKVLALLWPVLPAASLWVARAV